MKILQKIWADANPDQRLVAHKTAMVAFAVVTMGSMLLGHPGIGFGLIALAYLVLGYRKYKKFVAAKGVSK